MPIKFSDVVKNAVSNADRIPAPSTSDRARAVRNGARDTAALPMGGTADALANARTMQNNNNLLDAIMNVPTPASLAMNAILPGSGFALEAFKAANKPKATNTMGRGIGQISANAGNVLPTRPRITKMNEGSSR